MSLAVLRCGVCFFLVAALSGCGQSQPASAEPAAPAASAASAAPAEPAARAAEPSGPAENSSAAGRPPGPAIDWPSFLGPKRDSRSPETGILTRWPQDGPPIQWTKRLGTGYGTVAVSDGRLFVFTRFDNTATLLCLDPKTGQELWRSEYPTQYEDLLGYDNGPRCQPVVDGERVYTFGPEGMLICHNTADGKVLWRRDTAADFGVVQNFFGVGSTPLVEGDLLICNIGGSPPDSPENVYAGAVEGNGTGIVAFDKRTGEVRYQFSDELASYASPVCATIDGVRWGFQFARGGLIGFDPQQGKPRFHFPWRATILESVNASNPVIVGDKVLISECYGPGAALLQVKGDGYQVVWSDEDKGRGKSLQTHWMTPIEHQGYVYACSGRHSQTADLRCVQLATGKVTWAADSITVDGRPEAVSRCSLLWIDGHFVCLSEYGTLMLFRADPRKFDLVAVCAPKDPEAEEGFFGKPRLLKYPCWAAPVVSHGLLYLRGEGRLVCMELIPPRGDAD